MSNKLPMIPLASPMIDANGVITQSWAALIREMYKRIGGSSAETIADIAATVDAQNAKITTFTSSVFSGLDDLGQGRDL
jgi:hypothetical protein